MIPDSNRKGCVRMAAFDKAGKAANEFFEKAIGVTEGIAVKAVDAIDVLEEVTLDLAQNAKEKATETGDFVIRKAAKATSAIARTTQNIADKMEEFIKKPDQDE